MNTQKKVKYIHEGNFVAEVEVNIILDDNQWAPYLSLDDAYMLDDIRDALRKKDFQSIPKNVKVYKMHPIAI